MEKRIGILAILVETKECIPSLNKILGQYSDIVLSRQGLPLPQYHINLISIMVKGTNDQIGALSGKLGRLPGLTVKSVLTKFRENSDESRF
ncbi:TM1266 family iron-only hydrogenase system putative regulator [Spirochaeta cellobiosiphila]|uniref:TM1266 family iron-only hydrogenase system putative regulator n=1 Tax=Spirochaeta cellobiosiphila TaxID=504483 RepID=UPI0003F9564A|nr:TM1266 family iron-only hydrogenase system putative regulator [Spirochaeta cellobiosiphila]